MYLIIHVQYIQYKKMTPENWYLANKGHKNPLKWMTHRMNGLRKAYYEAKANAYKQHYAASAGNDNGACEFKPTTNSPPPWFGTATSPDFKNIVKDTDPTTFTKLTDAGQKMRKMFDRRTGSFKDVNAHLFNAQYKNNDGLNIEVQVNPEFTKDKAREYAKQYATVIGRLPKALRRYVKTVWIQGGKEPFGGGNNNLLIHVEQGKEYKKKKILEEIFIHEACHTSLDDLYANNTRWINSRKKDNTYISTYAATECGKREDIAESFLAYFAVTYRKNRISSIAYNNIVSTIPNRIKFLNSLNLDMYPYTKSVKHHRGMQNYKNVIIDFI